MPDPVISRDPIISAASSGGNGTETYTAPWRSNCDWNTVCNALAAAMTGSAWGFFTTGTYSLTRTGGGACALRMTITRGAPCLVQQFVRWTSGRNESILRLDVRVTCGKIRDCGVQWTHVLFLHFQG